MRNTEPELQSKPSNNSSIHAPIHVVAAAIVNQKDEVLISLRHAHLHQGGLWEFPGGKVEANESARIALSRELNEELGINVREARPLIKIKHDYSDKSVLLDVWLVNQFDGELHGREGQECRWVGKKNLNDFNFPAANNSIVAAVQLPSVYLITPDPQPDRIQFLSQFKQTLGSGNGLIQLRAKSLSEGEYKSLAIECQALCKEKAVSLLLNCQPELVSQIGASGVHLTSQRLHQLSSRPLGVNYLVAASCHDLRDLQKATEIDVDFAVLSPVKQTSTHPEVAPIGWGKFNAMADVAGFPVYALGGMSLDDLSSAYNCGGQGVAGITGFWRE